MAPLRRASREAVGLDDPERLTALVRALAASVNVRLLALLAAERDQHGDDAWVYLSDAALRLGEAPGTVSQAVVKLLIAGLAEERRQKGRRYFRANVTDVTLQLER